MILIKDRHHSCGLVRLFSILGNMILIKDRHSRSGRNLYDYIYKGNMILIKDRHIQMPYIFPPSSSDLENMVLMKFVMICCLMCVDTVVIMA